MAHIMSNRKRHVKWDHVDPEVAKIVRKYTPIYFLQNLRNIIATRDEKKIKRFEEFNGYDYDKNEFWSALYDDMWTILLNLKKIQEDFKDPKERKLIEAMCLWHEIWHNNQNNLKVFEYKNLKKDKNYRKLTEKYSDEFAIFMLEKYARDNRMENSGIVRKAIEDFRG